MTIDILGLLDLVGSVCIGAQVWLVECCGTILGPEFLVAPEEILELALEVGFFCCCVGKDILLADDAVGSGPGVTEEAAGVFGVVGALGEWSPNKDKINA